MSKFRKKPVIVEAFQMTKEHRVSNLDWLDWMREAWNKNFHEEGSLSCVDFPNSDGTDKLQIRTLEGMHLVNWDDYIIQGIKGELYPCKPDIFEATYEKSSVVNNMQQLTREQMEKWVEIFNNQFMQKPHNGHGLVRAKISEPKEYKGDPHLQIFIGDRDIAIDKNMIVTGSGGTMRKELA